ncbi:unnamed protein product [Toxocara canis]|uniref:UDP-galactose translocator n=2 Tax=Toxocara canis TaxID=6265 RepID=A0A183UJW6_TOXCA|nr:unnamed protein product [Toxocara canis]
MNEDSTRWYYKYVGIVLLTLQQASMPLMVRGSRYRNESEVFSTTVNVFMMEIIKITVCATVIIVTEKSIMKFIMQCKTSIMDDAIETAKVCVPAVIYTLQNNLYYIALSHLEATTFCLAYQMKIFTTALFLRFMLKRNLSVQQWFALLLLAIGVADVQIQYEPPSSAKRIQQYPIIGFLAVISMCFTSAFAGVYLEKVLKQSSINIWMQNVRLSLLGIPMSAISVFVSDYDLVARGEMFRGFDTLVWIMTITNSVGGLLISIVIKYADNILKAYAQSMAIVGAAIGSWIIFDFVPNLLFTFGALAVIISVYIYTAYPYVDYEQIVQTTKDRITINK